MKLVVIYACLNYYQCTPVGLSQCYCMDQPSKGRPLYMIATRNVLYAQFSSKQVSPANVS